MRIALCFFAALLSLIPSLAVTKTGNNLTVTAGFPEVVSANSFTFNVSMLNLVNKSRVVEVYSYVYKGSKSVSGAWTSNLEMVDLPPLGNSSFSLTNSLEQVNGLHSIKLRVREGERDLDLKSYVVINQTLKSSGVTGYSVMKPVSYAALSVVGLAALYVVMRKL